MINNIFVIFGFLLFLNTSLCVEKRKCGINASDNMVSASIQRYQDAKVGSFSTNTDLNWIGVQFHIVKEDDGSGGLNQNIIPKKLD